MTRRHLAPKSSSPWLEALQNEHLTREQLQKIICQLPLKKRTLLVINDITHTQDLTHRDVGLALGVAAARVMIAEKGGKEIGEEGRALLMEEGRLLLLEGLVPFLEENLNHIVTVTVTFVGSVLGVLFTHVPLLQMVGQIGTTLTSEGGSLFASIVPVVGYLVCLTCGHFVARIDEK